MLVSSSIYIIQQNWVPFYGAKIDVKEYTHKKAIGIAIPYVNTLVKACIKTRNGNFGCK